MQSTSSNSLFTLGLGSTGARAITERTASDMYSSMGTGSVIIIQESSAAYDLSGQERVYESLYFVFFWLLSSFWFYPCVMNKSWSCSSSPTLTIYTEMSKRVGILLLACLFMGVAASELLWYFQLTAALMFFVRPYHAGALRVRHHGLERSSDV